MLVRFYWDEKGAFIANDDHEFATEFDEMCGDLGKPDRIRVGPREGWSTDYPAGADVPRDDSVHDECGKPHNECSCDGENWSDPAIS